MSDRVALSGLDAVRTEAVRRAVVLLGEGDLRGEDRRSWLIEVRDEAGNIVLNVTLAELANVHTGWM